jgi:hypothetical protein
MTQLRKGTICLLVGISRGEFIFILSRPLSPGNELIEGTGSGRPFDYLSTPRV